MQQQYRGGNLAMRSMTAGTSFRPGWTALALLMVLCRAPAIADNTIEADLSPAQMQSGSLLLRMQAGYVTATRMNTDVSLRVSGLVARVAVHQEFRNDGTEWVEGVYVFPLPDSAAVDRLRMRIGERYIEGEIREKQQARKEYEQAKRAGKKTSLVEQQRANMFTTSVANIGPGETVSIEIEYLETAHYDDGTFSLRFPLTLTPRFMPGTPVTGRKGSGWSPDTTRVDDASLISPPVITRSNDHRVTLQADLDAGVALTLIASRYHPIEVTERSGSYRVNLSGSDVPMDHDFELLWRPVPDSAPRAMLFAETARDDTHVLLMIIPPDEESPAEEVMSRELIFVIDTSGSMHGVSIEQARKALLLALDSLHPGDRFNVIQFNTATSALAPGSLDASTPNIGMAKRYVSGLAAQGGTNMRPALEQALRSPASATHLRQIIFITDGSVGNEEELFRLIHRDLRAARLFTIGIGSAPNGWFMRKAAETGRGSYTFVSALHEVQEKMDRLFRKLEQPQLTNVRIQWPDSVSAETYPATNPDLYAGEPVLLKARLQNAPRAGDLVQIGGDSAMGRWGVELSLADGKASPGVAAVWARARIEDLADKKRRGANKDKIQSAIVETALAYGLVTRHTSLVAIDKTPARPAERNLQQEQVANLLPYGQSHQAIFGFAATATAASLHRRIGAMCGAVALLLLLLRRPRRVSPVRL